MKNVYLNKNNEGTIVCPQCSKAKQIKGSRFKKNKPIKLTCVCKHIFHIQLEQRRSYRKPVNLSGRFEKVYPDSGVKGETEIRDISATGLKLKTNITAHLHEDDIVRISFALDDQKKSRVDVEAMVRNVRGPHVGLEFHNLEVKTHKLITQYLLPATPSSYLEDMDVGVMEQQRRVDEASRIQAVQKELQRHFKSSGISHGPVFSGESWEEAITRFRAYWETHYICTNCNTITSIDTAMRAEYTCRKCQGGRYINTPKEMWDIILKYNPQRQRYFTVYDAFLMLDMDIAEFRSKHPNGFLVPFTKHMHDNPVIVDFKTIYEETRQLGVHIDKDDIEIRSTEKDIREIRKTKGSTNLDKLLIGRSVDKDLIFEHKDISRTHACIFTRSPDLTNYLIDLKSSNGTFINKKRLKPNKKYKLFDGCKITFGSKVKVVYLSSDGLYRYFNSIIEKDNKKE